MAAAHADSAQELVRGPHVQDLEGITVANEAACAMECFAMDGCNAASYYVDTAKPPLNGIKKNCWLKKLADVCAVHDMTTDDANAVLITKPCASLSVPPAADGTVTSRAQCCV
jgi:hypothetical protein